MGHCMQAYYLRKRISSLSLHWEEVVVRLHRWKSGHKANRGDILKMLCRGAEVKIRVHERWWWPFHLVSLLEKRKNVYKVIRVINSEKKFNGFFVLFSFYFVAFNSLFCFCTYFEIGIISFAENLCFFFFFHFFEFSCWLSSTIRRLCGFHWSCEFMISVGDCDWYTYTNCCQIFFLCSLKAN